MADAKLLRDFREDLVGCYKESVSYIPISPVRDDLDEPLEQLYVQPQLMVNNTHVFGQRGSANSNETVNSYKEIFFGEQNSPYKHIYISANAGMGKTSFARKVTLTWCEALKPGNNPNFDREDLETVKHFEIIFHIELPHMTKCDIADMISDFIEIRLCRSYQYSKAFVLNTNKCLVILDGLDQWTQPESYHRQGVPHNIYIRNVIVMTTTRPWKMSEMRLSTNQIDRHLDLLDLTRRTAKNQLVCIWADGRPIGRSEFEAYYNIIALNIERRIYQRARETRATRSAVNYIVPEYMKNNPNLAEAIFIFLKVRELGLVALCQELTTPAYIFDKKLALKYLASNELNFFTETGILPLTEDTNIISERREIVTFQHKAIEELFVALFMASVWKRRAKRKAILLKCRSLPDLIEASINNVMNLVKDRKNDTYKDMYKRMTDKESAEASDDIRLYGSRLTRISEEESVQLIEDCVDEKQCFAEGSFGKLFKSDGLKTRCGITVAIMKIHDERQLDDITNTVKKEMNVFKVLHPFLLPLIAVIREVDEGRNTFYLISPFCEQGDLYKVLQTNKTPLNKVQRTRIVLQIALGIQHLHTFVEGFKDVIIHKNICSDNIILDGRQNARLIDFGLARDKGDDTNNISKRIHYTHPDVGTGREATEFWDYFSFGVVIRELLTGLPPEGKKETNLFLKKMKLKDVIDNLDQDICPTEHDIYDFLDKIAESCLQPQSTFLFQKDVVEKLQSIFKQAVWVPEKGVTPRCAQCMINPATKLLSIVPNLANYNARSRQLTRATTATAVDNIVPEYMQNNPLLAENICKFLKVGELGLVALCEELKAPAYTFDKKLALKYIKSDEIEFFAETGILSLTKDSSIISERRDIVTFQHKAIEEFFVALFIASVWKSRAKRRIILLKCRSLPDLFEASFINVMNLAKDINNDTYKDMYKRITDKESAVASDDIKLYGSRPRVLVEDCGDEKQCFAEGSFGKLFISFANKMQNGHSDLYITAEVLQSLNELREIGFELKTKMNELHSDFIQHTTSHALSDSVYLSHTNRTRHVPSSNIVVLSNQSLTVELASRRVDDTGFKTIHHTHTSTSGRNVGTSSNSKGMCTILDDQDSLLNDRAWSSDGDDPEETMEHLKLQDQSNYFRKNETDAKSLINIQDKCSKTLEENPECLGVKEHAISSGYPLSSALSNEIKYSRSDLSSSENISFPNCTLERELKCRFSVTVTDNIREKRKDGSYAEARVRDINYKDFSLNKAKDDCDNDSIFISENDRAIKTVCNKENNSDIRGNIHNDVDECTREKHNDIEDIHVKADRKFDDNTAKQNQIFSETNIENLDDNIKQMEKEKLSKTNNGDRPTHGLNEQMSGCLFEQCDSERENGHSEIFDNGVDGTKRQVDPICRTNICDEGKQAFLGTVCGFTDASVSHRSKRSEPSTEKFTSTCESTNRKMNGKHSKQSKDTNPLAEKSTYGKCMAAENYADNDSGFESSMQSLEDCKSYILNELSLIVALNSVLDTETVKREPPRHSDKYLLERKKSTIIVKGRVDSVQLKDLHEKYERHTKQYFKDKTTLSLEAFVRDIHISYRTIEVFGLSEYFDRLNRGESLSDRDRMNYEWLRLASFQHYTGNGNALSLARNGFYHDQADGQTSTRCYLCEARHSTWEYFDNIEAEHRRQSPDCPFHSNRSEESINVSISYETTSQSHRAPPSFTPDVNSTAVSSGISNSGTASLSQSQTSSHGDRSTLLKPKTKQTENHEVTSFDGFASREPTSTATNIVSSSVASSTGTSTSSVLYQQSYTLADSNASTTSTASTSNSTTSSSSTLRSFSFPAAAASSSLLRPTQIPIGGGGRTDPTITVVVNNAKHPDYRELDARVNSYQGWPDYLDQTSRQMAEAGFFFVGVADFTRCFCCGGGLRNWEPGDDPMLEHTRWFPRCEYVNKLKGERYVAAVQRRHQQHMEEQQRQQQELARSRDANRNPPDPMSTEAAAILREMGYQQEKIRDAILAVRRQIGVPDVTTQQVLAWLLDQHEAGSSPTSTRSSPTRDLGVKVNDGLASLTIQTSSQSSVVNTTSTPTTTSTTLAGACSGSTSVRSSKGGAGSQQTSSSISNTISPGSKETGSKLTFQTGSKANKDKEGKSLGKQSAASGGESDDDFKSAEEFLETPSSEVNPAKKKNRKKRKSNSRAKSSGASGGLGVDAQALKEENEKLREMQTCKICMERPVNTTLLPCGHLICCDLCAARLNKCPICRKRIKGTVKTFMS